MKPVILGILGAFFFSFTYVLNRSMALDGGSWIWSVALRYLFLLVFLLPIIIWRKTMRHVYSELRRQFWAWFFWSFVGFVIFYIPLTAAAVYVPAWFIAVTWEVTLIAGILMSPFFYHTIQTSSGVYRVRQAIPWRSLILSSGILFGVFLVQLENIHALGKREVLTAFCLICVAATAYPLGNRKMMEVCGGRLDAFERIFGMTVVTLPWWVLLAVYGALTVGMPGRGQIVQSLMVAFLVSLVATVLFFKATDMVKDDMCKLAGVEATQACEILFALAMEVVWLNGEMPSLLTLIGIVFILAGMLVYSHWIRKVSN